MADSKKDALRDLAISLALIAISLGITRLTRDLLLSGVDDPFLKGFLVEAAMSMPAFVATFALGRTSLYQWDGSLLKAGWTAGLFSIAYSAFQLVVATLAGYAITASPIQIVLFVAQMALVGYCEEMLFRGYAQNAFHRIFGEDSQAKVLLAVACSGLLFGGMHIVNALNPTITFTAALTQSLNVIFFGMYIGAVYFRTGRCLWFLAALHALNDMSAFLSHGVLSGKTADAIINGTGTPSIARLVVPIVLFGGLTLFLLRPSKVKPLLHDEETGGGPHRAPADSAR